MSIAILIAFTACKKSAETSPTPPRPVRYAIVSDSSITEASTFSAAVQSRDATPLSFRVGGNVVALNIRMGQAVKKGFVLAKLDNSDYRVQLAQAQANWQAAKTQKDTAERAFRRVEKLYEAGSGSRSDYDNADGQLKSAKAQVSAASQQVRQAKNQVDYCELRAPFDGIVDAVDFKRGQVVAAGAPVAVVSKGGELEVAVGVPERIAPKLKVGSPATVKVSAIGDDPLLGTVREVGFSAQASTFPVRISLQAARKDLRPGMAATVRFELGSATNGLTIPNSDW